MVLELCATKDGLERVTVYLHTMQEMKLAEAPPGIFKAVQVKMGLPLRSAGSLTYQFEGPGKPPADVVPNSQVTLAGFALAQPEHAAFQSLSEATASDLVREDPDFDLSDKAARAIKLLYMHTPQSSTTKVALQWLKEYIFSVENALTELCYTFRTSARCLHAEIVTDAGHYDVKQEYMDPHISLCASKLGKFLTGDIGLITAKQLAVCQLIMTGALVVASSVAGLAESKGKAGIHITLADLGLYDELLCAASAMTSLTIAIPTNTPSAVTIEQMKIRKLLANSDTPQTSIVVTHVK